MDLREAYGILEVAPGAPKSAVREARNLLAKVWHPDRHQGDAKVQSRAEQKLKQINQAYSVIESAGFPSAVAKPNDGSTAEPRRDQAPSPPKKPAARPYDQKPPHQQPPRGQSQNPPPPPPPPRSQPDAARTAAAKAPATSAVGWTVYTMVAVLGVWVVVYRLGSSNETPAYTPSERYVNPQLPSASPSTSSSSQPTPTLDAKKRQVRPSLSGPLVTFVESCVEAAAKRSPDQPAQYLKRACFCIGDYIAFHEMHGRSLAPDEEGDILKHFPPPEALKSCGNWAARHQGAEALNGSPFFQGMGLSTELVVATWNLMIPESAKALSEWKRALPNATAFEELEFRDCITDVIVRKSRWPDVHHLASAEVNACAKGEEVATRPTPAVSGPTQLQPSTKRQSSDSMAASRAIRPPISDADPDNCTESSCVVDGYNGPCCAKFVSVPEEGTRNGSGGGRRDLDKVMISTAMSPVKAKAIECGNTWPVKGLVRIHVVVGADGSVTDISVLESPDVSLSACVAAAVKEASFPQTRAGGSFSYPFPF